MNNLRHKVACSLVEYSKTTSSVQFNNYVKFERSLHFTEERFGSKDENQMKPCFAREKVVICTNNQHRQ